MVDAGGFDAFLGWGIDRLKLPLRNRGFSFSIDEHTLRIVDGQTITREAHFDHSPKHLSGH